MVDCRVCNNFKEGSCLKPVLDVETKQYIIHKAVNPLFCGDFEKITENICFICKNLDEKKKCIKRFCWNNTYYYKSNPNEKECEFFERNI